MQNLFRIFFASINSQNYFQLPNYCGGQYKTDLEELLSDPDNFNNHVGILNVTITNSINIVSEISSEEYAPNLNLLSVENADLYLVEFFASVYEDGPFFYSGINYVVFVCSSENGMRKITGFITPSMETIYAYESNVEQANAFGSSRFGLPVVQPYACCWFYYSFSQMPTSIIVKQEIYNNGAITTVNFKEFCRVATACEFSYDSYPIEYLRTGALCVRNYAWYYYINNNNSSLGYHITDNSSKHLSYHPQDIPLSSIPRTCAAVNYIWNIRMENSDGNLFCSWFHQSAGAYQGSGRVSQNYAKTLAENGANYVEILHCFYDNSDRSDESIIITCNGSHSSIKVEPYSYLYHGPACTKCHTHTGTGSAHTFVNYNTHYECTVCGYTTMSPALPKRASGEDVLQ